MQQAKAKAWRKSTVGKGGDFGFFPTGYFPNNFSK